MGQATQLACSFCGMYSYHLVDCPMGVMERELKREGKSDMNMDDERQRSISAKIERLRQRAKSHAKLTRAGQHRDERLDLVGILLGILDLLGDEL
jgi:hypothetical protein